MINSVTLVGRLTKDIELRVTSSNVETCTFTLACDKRFKPKNENEPSADFIQCVAWRQSAKFLNQYAHKGDVVAIEGSIQTRSYDGQNGKVYVTEVVCDLVRLISKSTNPVEQQAKQFAQDNNAEFVPNGAIDITPDDLPF